MLNLPTHPLTVTNEGLYAFPTKIVTILVVIVVGWGVDPMYMYMCRNNMYIQTYINIYIYINDSNLSVPRDGIGFALENYVYSGLLNVRYG